MNRQSYIYRVIIASARTTAVVVIAIGLYYISETTYVGGRYGPTPSEWEMAKLLMLIGYAAFTLFPVRLLLSKRLDLTIAVGCLLSLGSAFLFYDIYVDLVIVSLKGQFVYHIMASILLIPVYGYVPALLALRRRKVANQSIQPTAKQRGG